MTLASCSLVVAGFAVPVPARAQKPFDTGDWVVRVHATHQQVANQDSSGRALSIDGTTSPEIDVTRFLAPWLALELGLAGPRRQTMSAGGVPVGSIRPLSSVLVLQYHVTGLAFVRPHAGVGIDWTHFSRVNLGDADTAGLRPSIRKDTFGLALQAGVDFPMRGGWLFNADAKWVRVRTDIDSGASRIGSLRLAPWRLSLGAGYRF